MPNTEQRIPNQRIPNTESTNTEPTNTEQPTTFALHINSTPIMQHLSKWAPIAVFVLVATLFSCKPNTKADQTASTTAVPTKSSILDTFADLQILHYELPGWDQLTLKQKTLIYYLGEAALSGRDIIYDQHCKYNLAVRKTNEAIMSGYKGDRTTTEWKAFEVYAKRVWFSNGIHHHYSETKLEPTGFTADYFKTLVAGADASLLPMPAEQVIAQLSPVIFDPTVMAKRTNKDPKSDIVATSAVNFYEGVTSAEVDKFYGDMIKAGGKNAPMFGLNSKLVKENGKLVEKVWKSGGMYGPAIDKIIFWLEKAKTVAETEQQAIAIGKLVDYYKSGDLKKFDEFNIAWVKDTESTIDFINGFIEVYHDPKGYKADFEAIVQYNDPDATQKMAVVSKNAQYFEDNSTIMQEHKKPNVKGVSYRVINVAMEGGDCSPATPIGVNLPNSNWIRETHGSKSISLNNIEDAYGKAGGAAATQEFANDADEIAGVQKYVTATGKMHTALHEVIGHASGQLNPGIPEPNVTLKHYSSTLEEARADLVALYFMPDPKLVEMGLLPDTEAYKTEFDTYIRNGLMQQLRRVKPGEDLEEDHMRNRQLVAAWAFEKGKDKGVVVREVRNGKTYFDVKDYAALRALFGDLLREIQRIKSEGDFKAAEALVETYGVKTDAELCKEVKARYGALPTKAYSGFVQPKLVPVTDANGNITDIKVEKEHDFVKQMLRFGKEYSFLK
jgi:dipeptidyl-peptidase III